MSEQFEEAGYTVHSDPFGAGLIDQICRDAERIRDELLTWMTVRRLNDPRATWWQLPDGTPYLLKIKSVMNVSPAARELANSPWMMSTVSALLGCRAQPMEDKLMYKQRLTINADWARLPVLGEEVRKHTDAAYFQSRGFSRVITVAVCLDDCTTEAGALKVWPRTHGREIATVNTERQGPVIADEDAPDDEAILLAAPRGTVLMWDARLVHASGPNNSGKPRRLLVLGFAPQPDSRQVNRSAAEGSVERGGQVR